MVEPQVHQQMQDSSAVFGFDVRDDGLRSHLANVKSAALVRAAGITWGAPRHAVPSIFRKALLTAARQLAK
jgi:hypothetical protein